MNVELLEQLQAAQAELDPQFKALHAATAALKTAVKLASEEKAEALALQKALVKLEQANQQVDNQAMEAATQTFAAETERALDALAFAFARDLKEAFEGRGQHVEGRPPTLVVDSLVLNINMAARKAQWFYGKEALTRLIPLSISSILKAYDQQRKAVVERVIDVQGFLSDLYKAWQNVRNKRTRPPSRTNVVETYSELVMNRQSSRFWNAPSRSTFKDYPRHFFVRDLTLAQSSPAFTLEGQVYRLHLGTATKNQADSASRSIWLPSSALDGSYYGDVTFEAVEQ
jgi:hypothetical protein